MSIHAILSSGVCPSPGELPQHNESLIEDVRAFISDLPFPEVQSRPWDRASPSILSFQEDEDVIGIDGTTEKSTLDGIPTELTEHDGYRNRMRMVQCQLYLLRCEVLQSRANAVEPKPWTHCPNLSTPNHYRDILKCARYAQRLAEAISNYDLQARSKYWYGRGCAGLGDWESAISHFAAALKLHVPNSKPRNRMRRQRSALRFKKHDAKFLLRSVIRHYDLCTQKRKDACKTAHTREEDSGHIGESGVGAPTESSWMPYYDNMVHRSREKSTTGKQSTLDQLLLGKSAPILDEEVVLTEEEIIAIKKRLKLNDGKREVRKIFDAKEWLYILRGDNIERNSVDSQDTVSDTVQSRHSEPSQAPSPASIITPPQSSPSIPHNLGAEMDCAGYDSGSATPSLFESPRSPLLNGTNKTAPPPMVDVQSCRDVASPLISSSSQGC